jgi:hypothetical protein
MKLHRVTRFPKHAFPHDLTTGNSAIDAYLQQLDAGLAGSTGVRRITVEEARDHILEHCEQLISQGLPERDAAERAVASFGAAEEHALAQRRERYGMFGSMFLRFGLIFATLMLLMSLLSPSSFLRADSVSQSFLEQLPLMATLFVFNTCFYGFFMSYWYTFAFSPAKPAPITQGVQGEVLQVYSPKSSKYAAIFLVLMMGTITISCVLGIFGIGYMASSGIVLNGILAVVAGQMVLGSHVAWVRYELSNAHFTVFSPLGTKTFAREQITDLVELPMWRQFLVTRLGKQYWLLWRNQDNKPQRTVVVINGEMHNGDQLIATLKSNAGNHAVTTR